MPKGTVVIVAGPAGVGKSTLVFHALSLLPEGAVIFVETGAEGAVLLKKRIPEAVTIYIMPPSPQLESLRGRLLARGDLTPHHIDTLLAMAKKDLRFEHHFDQCMTNPDIDEGRRTFLAKVEKILQRALPA